MEKSHISDRAHSILAHIESESVELSREIKIPVEQCRNLLLNRVNKYMVEGNTEFKSEDDLKNN